MFFIIDFASKLHPVKTRRCGMLPTSSKPMGKRRPPGGWFIRHWRPLNGTWNFALKVRNARRANHEVSPEKLVAGQFEKLSCNDLSSGWLIYSEP